jgi:ribosomal protein L23
MATEKLTTKVTKKAQKKEVVKETGLVLTPVITEKAARTQQSNGYVFGVPVEATKSEIAKAFEKKYKQKPVKVNLVGAKRKSTFRKGKLGFTTTVRKAYIFLKKGVTIEVI